MTKPAKIIDDYLNNLPDIAEASGEAIEAQLKACGWIIVPIKEEPIEKP